MQSYLQGESWLRVVAYGVTMGSQDRCQHACVLRDMRKTISYIGYMKCILIIVTHRDMCNQYSKGCTHLCQQVQAAGKER